MATILSEILDRKREVVARLRADRASQDFRQRALAIRKNAPPHRIVASTGIGLTAAEDHRRI